MSDDFVIPRDQAKEMAISIDPYITQQYEILNMSEEEYKNWWLNDNSKTFNFQTWESDLEQTVTCPRCGRTYKLKEAKVARGSKINDTNHFCKYYPDCYGSGLDLYLHLFDNDPEPNN